MLTLPAVLRRLLNRVPLRWALLLLGGMVIVGTVVILGRLPNWSGQQIALSFKVGAVALGVSLLTNALSLNRLRHLQSVNQQLAAAQLNQWLPTNDSISELNHLRQLAETVREGFFVYETESKLYSYVNPAYATIKGESLQAVYQGMSHWLDNIHPEDRPQIDAALEREAQGENFYQEYRYILPDGKVRWLISKAFPIRDETGTITRIVGTVEDISDRKATELALQESEARYRASEANLLNAQQIAHLGSWEFMPATEMINWSEELFHIFGLDPTDSEPAYAEIMAMIPEADRCIVATAINQAITNGTPYEIEHRIQRPDGMIRHLVSKGQAEMTNLPQGIRLFGTALDITDRKQAELGLQASEARFQEIAQTLNQISYVICVATGQYLYISPAYERLWGYSCASLYQNPSSWLDRVVPEDLDLVKAGLQKLLAGTKKRLQYRIFSATGGICWIESESSIVYDENGNPLRIVGIADDITDRKQLEQSLQEREAMLRAIGDNLPKGFIYQCTYESGISHYTYISAGIERLLGLRPEEVIANPVLTRSVGFDEDLAYADQIIQTALQHLAPIELQMRHRSLDGTVGWSAIRETPRQLADGQFVWDGVEIDITDFKRIETALRTSEELFRKAFHDAPIGMSLTTPDGQYLKVNARFCEITGYTEAELLRCTFQDITDPADVMGDLEGVQRLITGEARSFQMQKRYVTKTGEVVPVLMSTAPIRDHTGELLYFVGHVQDIRDRLKVERMKDEFISVVSHELRTPLTSIRGALGILESGVFKDRPEKANHMLQIAVSNSDRLVRLVNDILTFERLESGKVQYELTQCQVTDLMQEAVDGVQVIADQTSVTLSMTSLNATVLVSRDEIVQALTNLLSNAIKFSSPGATVWLRAKPGTGDWSPKNGGTGCDLRSPATHSANSYILFSVEDQGRGIPCDKFESIFDQFQQVDVSDSRIKGGTGLGLAICKKIVQQHGGQIWLDSTLGQGSIFYVALPIGPASGSSHPAHLASPSSRR